MDTLGLYMQLCKMYGKSQLCDCKHFFLQQKVTIKLDKTILIPLLLNFITEFMLIFNISIYFFYGMYYVFMIFFEASFSSLSILPIFKVCEQNYP